MARHLDIKRQARRDLHAGMADPAWYVRTPTAAPIQAHVRVTTKFNQAGDIKGARMYPAETENVSPSIIFQISEVQGLQRNGVVSMSATEAYKIDHLLPPDDEFQHAMVTRLTLAEIQEATLPVPDGTF